MSGNVDVDILVFKERKVKAIIWVARAVDVAVLITSAGPGRVGTRRRVVA